MRSCIASYVGEVCLSGGKAIYSCLVTGSCLFLPFSFSGRLSKVRVMVLDCIQYGLLNYRVMYCVWNTGDSQLKAGQLGIEI